MSNPNQTACACSFNKQLSIWVNSFLGFPNALCRIVGSNLMTPPYGPLENLGKRTHQRRPLVLSNGISVRKSAFVQKRVSNQILEGKTLLTSELRRQNMSELSSHQFPESIFVPFVKLLSFPYFPMMFPEFPSDFQLRSEFLARQPSVAGPVSCVTVGPNA